MTWRCNPRCPAGSLVKSCVGSFARHESNSWRLITNVELQRLMENFRMIFACNLCDGLQWGMPFAPWLWRYFAGVDLQIVLTGSPICGWIWKLGLYLCNDFPLYCYRIVVDLALKLALSVSIFWATAFICRLQSESDRLVKCHRWVHSSSPDRVLSY